MTHRASVAIIASLLAADATATARAAGALTPTYLRCEYRIDPLGIDVREPRLSWIVEAANRDERQTAYHVLVAASPEALKEDRGDLWDSGKVSSDETTAVVYAGKPLRTGQRCHWKVRTWDRGGQPSDWSARALWSMGLLDPTDWKAVWIGHDKPAAAASAAGLLDAARWIWFAEGNPRESAPVGTRYFLRAFDVPAGPAVRKATLAFAADNGAVARVNGAEVGRNGAFSAATRPDVTARVHAGMNVLAIEARNAGDAPNPAGLIAALRIEREDASSVLVSSDGEWLASDRESAGWSAPGFDAAGWSRARDLGPNGTAPWPRVSAGEVRLPPPRYVRKSFLLDRPVRRAVLHASALGLHEIHINGRRASEDYFTPGWTDYDRRVYYNTYDVTDLLAEGPNAIAGIVADGWYAGYVGFGGERDHYGDKIRILAQLDVDLADGSRVTIATGPDWKASTGPLLEADFLMGESYDARKAMPGWDRAGFDDSKWDPVDVTPRIAALVQAYPGVAVRELEPIRPVKVTEPAPGRLVYDLGQNFAGVVRLKVHGAEAGQTITLRHAEMLNPDGTIYVTNLRSARATDRYIALGGEEAWQPRFTFHGFRYVELTGYPGRPPEDAVTGIPLSSATPLAGSFSCDVPMLNRLFQNIRWTQRMNFIDIPTDCPQRDERLGWTGDAQVYIRTASMIADTQAFYTKWLVDLYDAQRADGQFPMVAPLKSKGVSADGGPAWADAGVVCPWTAYDVYGDRRLLERHFDGMKKFVQFCRGRCTPDLLPPAKFHCFGDWLSINAQTPTDVIFEAYFAYSTSLVARAAEALGKADDAREHSELFEKVKAAFNKAYVADDGRIKGDTQAVYVLAIQFDLVDGPKREAAARRLVEDIEKRDGHLSTGFIGTKDLMLVLSKIGREDVAFRLLRQTTFPSWGFSIEQGATTIWERWDGWTPEKGFQDAGMNSFAHYSFGAVYGWICENIGGIRSDGPGFKTIVIRPRLGGGIGGARTTYRSIHGEIATDWKLTGDSLRLAVTIPANTTALVHVPAADPMAVTEGGRAPEGGEGIHSHRADRAAGEAVLEVGSGRYEFASRVSR